MAGLEDGQFSDQGRNHWNGFCLGKGCSDRDATHACPCGRRGRMCFCLPGNEKVMSCTHCGEITNKRLRRRRNIGASVCACSRRQSSAAGLSSSGGNVECPCKQRHVVARHNNRCGIDVRPCCAQSIGTGKNCTDSYDTDGVSRSARRSLVMRDGGHENILACGYEGASAYECIDLSRTGSVH